VSSWLKLEKALGGQWISPSSGKRDRIIVMETGKGNRGRKQTVLHTGGGGKKRGRGEGEEGVVRGPRKRRNHPVGGGGGRLSGDTVEKRKGKRRTECSTRD